MKNFEVILKRLRPDGKWSGNMIPDTLEMFREELPNPTKGSHDNRFKYTGDDKPTEAEMLDEFEAYETSRAGEDIRRKRSAAFANISRHGYLNVLHYSELSDTQKAEIAEYRQQWKDAPETGVIPEKPEWMEA